jgi:hypothetical protein
MKYIPDELKVLLEQYSDFLEEGGDAPAIACFQTDLDHPRFNDVVEVINKRRQALDSGNIDEAKELLSQAYGIALKHLRQRGLQSSLESLKPEVAKEEITMVRDYCNSLLKALDGKLEKDHPVKEEREREKSYEDWNRFIDAATAFAKEHGRKPTKQDLRNDYEFRGDFLKQVAAVPMFAEYLAKGKPGPKQSQ